MSIEKLPDEIVMKIFDYLNPVTKLICGVASRKLKAISDISLSKHIWADFKTCLLIYADSKPRVDLVTCLRSVIYKCPKIEQLIIDMVPNEVSLDSFKPFCQYGTITYLEISFGVSSSFQSLVLGENWETHLTDAISTWKNLKSFKLSSSGYYATDEFIVNLLTSLSTSVTHFRIDFNVLISFHSKVGEIDDALETFVKTHPNLHTFEFNMFSSMSPNTNYNLERAIGNLHKFCHRLKVVAFGRHLADLGNLSLFDQLECLKFNHVYNVLSNNELSTINSVAHRLKTLSLNARLFTSTLPMLMAPLQLLQNLHIFCDYLYPMECNNNKSLSIEYAEQFFYSLPNLHSISVPLLLFNSQFLKYPICICPNLNEITCSSVLTKDVSKCLSDIDEMVKLARQQRQRDNVGGHVSQWKICVRLISSTVQFATLMKHTESCSVDNVYIVNYAK